MDIGTQLDYLRKEHLDILRFLGEWRYALELVTGRGDERRRKGLEELRGMEGELLALRNHCRLEERILESRYSNYLQKTALERLRNEHRELERLIQDTMRELRFATMDQTTGIADSAAQLAAFGRQHILCEEKLLAEIERGILAETKLKPVLH